MKKINWGILGSGLIASRLATAINQVDEATLYAVGSRSLEKSKDFSKKYSIEKAFGSYEELCACDEIDVIYIATPHSFHKEHTFLALENGKNVLCEKPFALNRNDAKEMIDYARERGLFIMEAMWSCVMPGLFKLKSLIEEGAIGQPKFIEADFGFQAPFDPKQRLFNPELGGGALLDVGIYPLTLGLNLFGYPSSYNAHASLGKTGVDEVSSYTLSFTNGVLGRFSSAISVDTSCSATVYGTEGSIHIPSDFWLFKELQIKNGSKHVIDTSYECNEYCFEVQEVCACLNRGDLESPNIPHSWTLNIMTLMDGLRKQMGLSYPDELAIK
jgi:dihydrodiol dehydrogenase / D-xylose 1-dehydrogenase (NADP)